MRDARSEGRAGQPGGRAAADVPADADSTGVAASAVALDATDDGVCVTEADGDDGPPGAPHAASSAIIAAPSPRELQAARIFEPPIHAVQLEAGGDVARSDHLILPRVSTRPLSRR
jgi:hypothetical protein